MSLVAKALVAIGPFGLALMALVATARIHFLLLKRHRIKKPDNYKFFLPLGIILVPVLHYAVFMAAYPVIDSVMGQKNSNHGYAALYVVTFRR
jgi:hypothetical protein